MRAINFGMGHRFRLEIVTFGQSVDGPLGDSFEGRAALRGFP